MDPSNPSQFDEASQFAEQAVQRALRMGGTCTGEHGIGYGKMKYLHAEHGEALEVMRTIKRALDPENPARSSIYRYSKSEEYPIQKSFWSLAYE